MTPQPAKDWLDQDFDLAATQQAGREDTIADPETGGPVLAIGQGGLGQLDHRIFHTASRHRPFEGAVVAHHDMAAALTRR